MTEVKCKVETCYYWGRGDICKADSIMVDNNTSAVRRGTTGMEIGDLDTRIGEQSRIENKSSTDVQTTRQSGVHAKTSDETLCATFRPKGSEVRH